MLVSATLSEEVEQLKARTRRRSELRRNGILVSGGPDAPQAGRPQAGGAARDGKAYTAGAPKGCLQSHSRSLDFACMIRFYFVCHKTDKYLIIYTLLILGSAEESVPRIDPTCDLRNVV